MLLCASALVFSLAIVAVPSALASSGFVYTHPSLQVAEGTSTGRFELAKTEFTPSYNVAFTPNPKIFWGDGSESEAESSIPFFNCFSECELLGAHTYKTPGTYNVEVIYNTGVSVWYSTSFTITVTEADLTFASIGDSAASGEGNPNGLTEGEAGFQQAIWNDGLGPTIFGTYPAGSTESRCHQSEYAAPTIAERQFESATERGVSYTQLACSGASIPEIIEKQVPNLPAGPINVLTMTMGANDIDGGFSHLVEFCLEQLGYCQEDASFTKRVEEDIAGLPKEFAKLEEKLSEHDIENVFVNEYFDPTHNADGGFGDFFTNSACTLDLLNAGTWQWAYEHVEVPLNHAIAAAAKQYGWHLVEGIPEAFRDHGFCAWTGEHETGEAGPDEAWVRAFYAGTSLNPVTILTSLESLGVEEQIDGTAHPNGTGERMIANSMANDMYKELGLPETTLSATGSKTEAPYSFGSDSTEPIRLAFSAKSPFPKLALAEATYYSINNAACSPQDLGECQQSRENETAAYLEKPGVYNIKYFSENTRGGFEQPKEQIAIVVEPPSPPEALVKAEAFSSSTGLPEGPYKFGSWTPDDVAVTVEVEGAETIEYAADDSEYEYCATDDTNEACKPADLPLTVRFSEEGPHKLELWDPHSHRGWTYDVDIERTPPHIVFDGYSPAPNAAGWNNTPVTLEWSCSPSASPLLTNSASATVSSEGADEPVSGTCKDEAGESATETRDVNIDEQPPTEVTVKPSRAPDHVASNGVPVFTAPFSVTATATDALSGLEECSTESYGGPPVTGEALLGTCTDNVGNQVGWSYTFDYTPTLKVAAPNPTYVYGQAIPETFEPGYSGFVEGDTPASLTERPTCRTTSTITGVGMYVIECSGGSSSEYGFEYVTGLLTITPAPLTVTANDQSRLFGAANPPLSATISGFVDGQTLASSGVTGAASCSTTATAYSPAGSYPILCTVGTLAATNYALTDFVAGALTIHYTAACETGTSHVPLEVRSGQAACIGAGSRQNGPVIVDRGGALNIEGATVSGIINSYGATLVRICGSTIVGPLFVGETSGLVLIGGDAATPGCAPNTIDGTAILAGNNGGVEFNGNTLYGQLILTYNHGSLPAPDTGSVHATGNKTIHGATPPFPYQFSAPPWLYGFMFTWQVGWQ